MTFLFMFLGAMLAIIVLIAIDTVSHVAWPIVVNARLRQ
jgi:hypothetical protein